MKELKLKCGECKNIIDADDLQIGEVKELSNEFTASLVCLCGSSKFVIPIDKKDIENIVGSIGTC